MTFGQRYTPQSPTQRYSDRMDRTAATMEAVRRAEKPSVSMEGGTRGARPKENVLESATYENAVRDLGFCVRCGRVCRPQFCHADMGKGQGIKTDVRRGWAGCGPGPWGQGCHYLVGTSGTLPKAERRAEDERLGALTRQELRRRGTWPKRVPEWIEGDRL